MTVYIDSLFVTNFFMNSVIFFVSGIIAAKQISILKNFAVSAFSALYGALMFLPRLTFMYGALSKIIVSSLFVLLAYGRRNYIKSLAAFWTVCGVLGGIILAISIFTDFGNAVQTFVSNGGIYLQISPIVSSMGSILVYVLIEVYRRMSVRNFSTSRMIIKISVTYLGNEYILTGLIDTGCDICEPLSGKPVIVAEKSIFSGVLSLSEIKIRTASGEGKAELIFPNRVESLTEGYKLNEKTPIVLVTLPLCGDGLYNALVNPNALYDTDGSNKESKNKSEALI